MSLQPFRVAVERSNGIRYYTLRSKEVKIRGGGVRLIYFFAPEGRLTSRSTGFEVVEALRLGLPLEGQIAVARALVDMQGFAPAEAAQIAGELKGKAEGLSKSRTQELIEDIRRALDNP